MITGLLAWFDQNCDNDCEHQNGFSLETTDNSGILVTIDIGENNEFSPGIDRTVLEQKIDEKNVSLRVVGGEVIGNADVPLAQNLFQKIDQFLSLNNASEKTSG